MQLFQNGTQGGTTPPAPQPAVGTPGYANSGPVGTFSETILDPDVVIALVAELANLVTASGQALTPGTFTQVTAAVNLLIAGAFGGAAHSLASPGYQKFPGGLILQWGRGSMSNPGATSQIQAVVFPIAFPNACLEVFGNSKGGSNATYGYPPVFEVYGETTTGFTAELDTLGANGGAYPWNQAVPYGWFAIGW